MNIITENKGKNDVFQTIFDIIFLSALKLFLFLISLPNLIKCFNIMDGEC